VPGLSGPRIDTCGTGGDASCSFNCSTAVALYLAGMGYQVVKHGNRAVSSSCGSADAVEALALPMLLEPEQVAEEVEKRNFAFLFAPNYHPAFKHIMPVRKDLGMRTLFNLMGPLLNPARPTHQLLGVAKAEIMQIMAEALRLGGVERAAVVHGAAGFDELSPFGPSKVVWISRGETVETELDPAELGIAPCDPEDVAVRDKDHALAVLRDVLAGTGPEAMQEMLVFNLAVALHLLEEEPLGTCVEQARDAVAQGAGMRPLG
jgi:anthranilate phosphoribosyltransferase